MQFYDLDVRRLEGTPSVGELARQALLLGYSGMAVIEPWGSPVDLSDLKADADRLKTQEFDIAVGVELQPKSVTELTEAVERLKDERVLMMVSGGDPAINRAACENPHVSVLAPHLDQQESGLDVPIMEAAARNGVAIELRFRHVLVALRRQRAALLGRLSGIIAAAEKARAPVIVTSGASSVWEMRDPRELIGLANVLGMELPKAFAAVSDNPLHIMEKGKERGGPR